jgi:hypothetical protein
MIVEYTRNPNEVLRRMYQGALSGPRAQRWPIGFTHTHAMQRIVTHPMRPFNVPFALRQSLEAILQIKAALEQNGGAFEDEQTMNLSYGRESQVILYASKGELHLQLTHHYLDLSQPNIFEVASVYTSMVQEYVAAKTGRRVGTHTHVVCVLKTAEPDSKLADMGHKLSFATERAVGADIDRFEQDIGMLIMESANAMGFRDRFVRRVAIPVFLVESALLRNEPADAYVAANQCQAEDWKMALHTWIKEKVK